MLLREASYVHQGCIYLIKNTVKQKYGEILLQLFLFEYIIKFYLLLSWQS